LFYFSAAAAQLIDLIIYYSRRCRKVKYLTQDAPTKPDAQKLIPPIKALVVVVVLEIQLVLLVGNTAAAAAGGGGGGEAAARINVEPWSKYQYGEASNV
jgi:hypothetical protein